MTIGPWARRLREASFRGRSFFIDSHEFSTGRNSVEHETPGQDRTFSEDIGRKTRVFTIEGHVLGDDYFRLRDNLIEACEISGPGELIHPYLGTKNVQCKSFSFRESTREGRIATFSIEFVEAGEATAPVGLFDQIASFFDAANNAVDAVKSAFDSAWDLTNVPGFVIDEAIVLFDNAIADVSDALEKVRSIPEKKSELEEKLAELSGKKETLIRDAGELSVEMTNMIKDLKDSVDDPEDVDSVDTTSGKDDKVSVMDNLINYNSEPTEIDNVTPSRQTQLDNEKEFTRLIRQNAVIASAEASVVKSFKTLQDAIRQRELLIGYIEDIIDDTEDDTVFQAFSDLKAKVIVTVPNATVVLSNEVTLNIDNVETSLTTVYDLTGSIDTEADFIDRNADIRNPAFIDPGEYIAVNE